MENKENMVEVHLAFIALGWDLEDAFHYKGMYDESDPDGYEKLLAQAEECFELNCEPDEAYIVIDVNDAALVAVCVAPDYERE